MSFAYSVSRSLEEAREDDEWPGKPLQILVQTRLDVFLKQPSKQSSSDGERESCEEADTDEKKK